MTGMALGPSGKWIDAIRPDGSVGDAARVSLEARLATVAHWLPLAAYHSAQDIEHVHRARVATRRAMAALKLYRDYLPCKTARWLKRRLKEARRAAGEARDLDVLAERLQREYGERSAQIVEKIAAERTAVQPHIVRVCERFRREDKFIRKAARLIDNVDCAGGCDSAAGAVIFRDWAAQQLALQTDDFLSTVPDEHGDLTALHQFRVRGKAFRYTIELLAPALPPEVRKTHYRTIEKLQEHLGQINDHVTACDRLREWAAEADDAQLKNALCALAEEEVAHLTAELAAWHEWWTPQRVERLRAGLSHQDTKPSPGPGEGPGEG